MKLEDETQQNNNQQSLDTAINGDENNQYESLLDEFLDANGSDGFDEIFKNHSVDNDELSFKQFKSELIRERNLREKLEKELEIEKQIRKDLQTQLQNYMKQSLQRQFESTEMIKQMQLEILNYKQRFDLILRNSSKDVHKHKSKSDILIIDSNKKDVDQHKCLTCEITLKSEVSFILHTINHQVDKENALETSIFNLQLNMKNSIHYQCPICLLSFDGIKIYSHIYRSHTDEKPLVCTECNIFCIHLDDLREHQQKAHQGVVLKVAHVDISDLVNSSVRTTKRTKVSQYNSYSEKKNSKRRLLVKMPTDQVNEPGTSTSSSIEDESQIDITNNSMNYIPNDFPENEKSNETLRMEVSTPLTKISEPKEEFKCTFADCEFTTTSMDKLNFHISAHTNTRYKCPYCPYVGNVLVEIHRHIQKSKKHEGMKIYQCSKCKFGSNCLPTFREHLGVHFGKKNNQQQQKINDYINSMFDNEYNSKTHKNWL